MAYAKDLSVPKRRKGHPISEESKAKISKVHKGKVLSSETRMKISKSRMGMSSARKGVHLSEETKQKLRDANLGKKLSREVKDKISNSLKGREGWNLWAKGIKHPKQSEIMSGTNNPNWKGGVSFEEYTKDWTDDLRESIRKRDGYVCQSCGIHQDELKGFHQQLDIHHIDYDKYNLNPNNLVSLCKSCHAKTNFNRDYWRKFYGVR